jgi:predicted RNA-binding protein
MCESNAYLVKGGEEALLMESVDVIEPEGDDAYRLVDIFGEQKIIKARIKGMNLVNHKIIFEQK